jgi:hypothetical protein
MVIAAYHGRGLWLELLGCVESHCAERQQAYQQSRKSLTGQLCLFKGT